MNPRDLMDELVNRWGQSLLAVFLLLVGLMWALVAVIWLPVLMLGAAIKHALWVKGIDE